jgi:glycosyltransferase involved in cell wall biosynthesis
MEKRLKVLMFGWELPPFNSGGLGVACYGLSKAMAKNADILFVLPRRVDVSADFLKLLFANNIKITTIDSPLRPYITPEGYKVLVEDKTLYGSNLFEEVERYALQARKIAQEEDFDIIHAHDWLSFQAGIAAKEVSGKPLVVQLHSTEYDRCGGLNLNKRVYEIEKRGMEAADKVIGVSNLTKMIIQEHYNIPSSKVFAVHNRINADEYLEETQGERIFQIKKDGKKIVLFAGRITLQKGPDYFIQVAKKVLEYEQNVLFVMAGSGDMEYKIMQDAAIMGISDKILFTGFLRGKELSHIFKMADIFVMPSVSEPFGIAALESIIHGTPVIVSKQSGVSEIVQNALKVDFWDIDEMTNKILSILRHDSLKNTLRDNSEGEVRQFSWDMAADQCLNLYRDLVH